MSDATRPRARTSRRAALRGLTVLTLWPAVGQARRAAEVPLVEPATDRVDSFLARQALALPAAEGNRAMDDVNRVVRLVHDDAVRRNLNALPIGATTAAASIADHPDQALLIGHMLAWQLTRPGSCPPWVPGATDTLLARGPVNEPEAWLRLWLHRSDTERWSEADSLERAWHVLGRTPARRVTQAIAHERAFLRREKRPVLQVLVRLERSAAGRAWPPADVR